MSKRKRRIAVSVILLALIGGVAMWHIVGRTPSAESVLGPAASVPRHAGLDKLISVDFVDITAQQAIDRISEMTGVPITVDERALDARRIDAGETVFLIADDVTARSALGVIARQLPAWGMGFSMVVVEDENGVRITSSALHSAEDTIPHTYDLKALVERTQVYYPSNEPGMMEKLWDRIRTSLPWHSSGSGSGAIYATMSSGSYGRDSVPDQYVRLVTNSAEPHIWQANGGTSFAATEASGVLNILATPEALGRVHAVLGACWRCVNSKDDQQVVTPTSPRAIAATQALDKRVTLHLEGAPRIEAVRQILAQIGVDGAVHMPSARFHGVGMSDAITVDLTGLTAGEAFTRTLVDPANISQPVVRCDAELSGIVTIYLDDRYDYGDDPPVRVFWVGDLVADLVETEDELDDERRKLVAGVEKLLLLLSAEPTDGPPAYVAGVGPMIVVFARSDTQRLVANHLAEQRRFR